MPKDKKGKAAEKKARVAQKAEKKATQKEKKSKNKPKKDDDSDAEDIDLDAVLKEYAQQQERFLKVTEAPSEPPSPRGSATFLASPANDNELFLFGGEHYNGAIASFYNDLFVYNINRDEWRLVTSPNSPLPRSGHAWCRGGNTKDMYLFGGEFSSPKQGTFYHYNDFWRLDPGSREWTRVESKGKDKSPPARSGHRMTYFKNYIILFGGFQDTSQTTKYLQDLWIYDCQTYAWHQPALPPASQKPDARSSFSLLPHENGAVLYGGYSRVKASIAAGKQTKGGSGGSRMVLKPVVHQDTWFLRITPPAADAPPSTLPKVHWERRKRPVNPPNPPRAGATMAYHKGRGIMFGGVHDVEESEEGIDSEFFNQLFAWNIERNRYFPLALRRPRTQGKKQAAAAERGRRGRGRADEEELLKNLAALEAKAPLDAADGAEVSEVTKATEDEEDQAEKVEKPRMFEFPHPRFNAQLAVQDDVLYIFGGTFEKGDREYTFDEMFALDLGKLDGVKEIFRREPEDWQGSEDEESEDEDEDDEDGSDDEEASDIASTAATSVSQNSAITAETQREKEEENAGAEETASSSLKDNLPHPRPFESLRDFYARTSVQWQEIVIYQLSRTYGGDGKSVKEVKKIAFDRAEEKWWDCREEIMALEDEQTEAGIGEVVSLGDKAAGDGGGSGVGRRR
ncbi:Kelch repeat-containing protein 3 [Coniosporium apollinis]|uniref:Kelch repeat-containing protein 3 n=1 Tax=Coniosporium apollinis TaxID=61459 RepID=A0ABQ9NVK5_9PEZI|nr:Kelch repeat-containing protein 3 [Coniosporium apollinis]